MPEPEETVVSDPATKTGPPPTEIDTFRLTASRVVEFMQRSTRALEIAHEGIHQWEETLSMTKGLQAMAHIAGAQEMDEEEKAILDDIKELLKAHESKFSRTPDEAEQRHTDVDLLYATTLIGIWGALDAFVADVVKLSLKHRPALLEQSPMAKITLPVNIALGNRDAIYDQIYSSISPPGHSGIGRFEAVLKLVGLTEGLTAETRRNLQAAYKVRNIWAHNGGYADDQFLIQCPLKNIKKGDRVDLTSKDFTLYAGAILDYISVIVERFRQRAVRES